MISAATERASACSVAAEIISIAWPIALNWLIMTSGGVVPLLLLRDDELGMAALGLATVLCSVTGRTLLWGLGAALDTYASQAWGAKEFTAIGLYGQRVLACLMCLVNVPLTVLWLKADVILRAMGQEGDVADQVLIYARLRLPGQYAAALGCVLTKVLIAIGETRVLLVCNVVTAIATLALLGGLVLGLGLGLEGAAIAMSAADGLQAAMLMAGALLNPSCRKCWGGLTLECFRGWPAYLKLAFPSLLMVCCEEWSWDAVTFLSGLTTTTTGGNAHIPQRRILATQGMLSSILNVCYSLSTAVGRGTGTVVGNALGARQPSRAKRAALVGVSLGCLVMCAVVGALIASRGVWSHVIPEPPDEPGSGPGSLDGVTEPLGPRDFVWPTGEGPSSLSADPTIGSMMAQLIPYVAIFVWADGLQMVLTGAITGAGVQAVTAPVLIVCYWLLGLPLGAVWAFTAPRLGLLGIWLGMIAAVYSHTTAYLLICFGGGCVPYAVRWDVVARQAQERVAESATGYLAPRGDSPETLADRTLVGREASAAIQRISTTATALTAAPSPPLTHSSINHAN